MVSDQKAPVRRTWICPHCNEPASATTHGVATWDGQDLDGAFVNPPVEYTFLQRDRCKMVAIHERENYGNGFEDDIPVVIFPAARRLNDAIPGGLRDEWDEARVCFDNKAFKACAVMVRRTLEGTCQDQGYSARTLNENLRKMQTDGKIDGLLAEWANTLRVVGNQGAHYTGVAVSRQDAEDALAFAEALLDHIYVLRQRFEELKPDTIKRLLGPPRRDTQS